ncbi:hypothetical protein GCM10009854_34370 [Saccharopolyspora halophila]|uniref:Uncharacterized protein n=1 Tax=Saccharopolyspora halophila TaxID=405551 RepID=A0ABP5TK35_9PSEU
MAGSPLCGAEENRPQPVAPNTTRTISAANSARKRRIADNSLPRFETTQDWRIRTSIASVPPGGGIAKPRPCDGVGSAESDRGEPGR